MPRIPEETLQQVLAATDIVDLVGRAVKLRRAGANFVGLCPFHTEKSPSFNVRPSTNSYHCFGCGAGGNAFRFLMENDGLTFMEAVKRLADAANIRIEDEVWDANAEEAAKRKALMIRAHRELAAWYHQLLMKHRIADEARAYLKSRGISPAVAKNWQIGYAPASTPMLRQWAAPFKFGQELLLEAGILGKGDEDSQPYPRFRNRLMFPIRNDNGDVIAFSGRLLDPEAKTAKYLNTTETPLFNKSKVLFGFDKSKRAISKADQAIVCEGQIDTIMLYEAGFQNVVAGQGTAFTEFHARALKRHTDEVVLCYDSDNAGYKAAERAFQVLAPAGLIVKVAVLPLGEDPDSVIRKQGAEAFATLLKGAQDFVDYQLASVGPRRNLTEIRERLQFAREMAENVKLFDTPLAQETTIQRVAGKLGIPAEMMRDLVSKTRKQPSVRTNKGGESENTGQEILAAQDTRSNALCKMALTDAQILAWLRQTGREEILRDLPGTELLSLVWRGTFDPLDSNAFNVFLAGLDRDQEAALTQLLFQPALSGGLAEAEEALCSLEMASMQLLQQRLETQLKNPALTPEDTATLLHEIMDLRVRFKAAQRSLAPASASH
ncbi:MAG: DNA primase [Prosthecobacter sp.]|nr:DNA primase [Prosthecobacter sp.]